jgi:hypothetical protein
MGITHRRQLVLKLRFYFDTFLIEQKKHVLKKWYDISPKGMFEKVDSRDYDNDWLSFWQNSRISLYTKHDLSESLTKPSVKELV